MMDARAWFDPAALMWAGPLLGVLEAAWGGALGLLGYGLVRRGRGRAVVYGHLYAGLAAALGFLAGGAVGFLTDQPTPIWASLLGAGAPLLVAALISRVNIGRAYRLIELNRMRALDA